MLNEIIEAVGYNNILKTIKQTQKINNSICLRLPKGRKIDKEADVCINETKEEIISKLELQEWFYERMIYSEKLSAKNKEIDKGGKYPSLTTSCQSNAIIFNIKTFVKKIKKGENKNFVLTKEHREEFKKYMLDFINSYMDRFTVDKVIKNWFKITKSKDIEDIKEKFELNKNYEDELIENHQLYIENIDYVIDEILNLKKPNDMKLIIFIENNIEVYKRRYMVYFTSKSYSQDTLIKVDGIKKGRNTSFMTLNSKKPFLAHMTNITDEIHLVDFEENAKINDLNKFMNVNYSRDIQNGIGNIEYKTQLKDGSIFITHYKNNPYQITDDLKKDIYIKDVLNSKSKEKVIKKYSELSSYILQLTDFKVKGFYGDMDKKRIEGKFQTFANMYYKYIGKLDNSNLDSFKTVYNNCISNLLKLYIYDEDVYKIINIINFDICMRDYLFNKNIKEELRKMIDKIKEKILKNDKENEYIIEDDMEFYVLCGQLAKYLKFKTQTDKITNKLFYEYNIITKTKQLIDILQKDKSKLDYDNNNNSRSGKILYGINNYYTINEKSLRKIDKIRFNMGLYYGKCILYVSDKNNENNNKNVEGEN